jgi:hypothetical protein
VKEVRLLTNMVNSNSWKSLDRMPARVIDANNLVVKFMVT